MVTVAFVRRRGGRGENFGSLAGASVGSMDLLGASRSGRVWRGYYRGDGRLVPRRGLDQPVGLVRLVVRLRCGGYRDTELGGSLFDVQSENEQRKSLR